MTGQLGMVVQAAGGVVWRRRKQVEVLVVHRSGYDDWTFPKGKRESSDAHLMATAQREVVEETGYRVVVNDELIAIDYVDRKGRYKHVTYWAMEPVGGHFVASREVDDMRWVAVSRVHEVLSYDRDRQVLAAFLRRLQTLDEKSTERLAQRV